MTIRRMHYGLPGMINGFQSNACPQQSREHTPLMNIKETDQCFLVELAVPGLTKTDCSIRLEKENELVVSVEKKQTPEQEAQPMRYLRQEFAPVRFQRTLILPDESVKERIEAKVEQGVLAIRIPKADPADKQKLSKQICVQ